MSDTVMPLVAYVGTYTKPPAGKAEGIYVYDVDPANGTLALKQTIAGVENPSFLTLDSRRRFLYAVNETSNGGVSAFAIDPTTGALTFLNRQPSRGDDPCHLCVDPTDRFVIVANYTSGSITVLPIAADGSLGAPSNTVQHHGSGPNPTRQAGPHMHMVSFSPDGQYLLAADLGLDRVFTYRLDTTSGTLVLEERADSNAQVTPGSGPRHFVFHPNGAIVYLINEIASTITVFEYDQVRGTLRPVQTVSTLPSDFSGSNTTAEIVVTPSGTAVYGSNRGHDSIAVFTVEPATGHLIVGGHEATQGKTPRNIALVPSSPYLYAANQDSDTIVTFHLQEETGKLVATGDVTAIPTPVCILVAGGRA